MLRYKIMAEAVTDIPANLKAIKQGIQNAVHRRPQVSTTTLHLCNNVQVHLFSSYLADF